MCVLEKPSGQHSHVCARVSLLKLPGGHNLQGNPARTRKNSTLNGLATRIGYLPIAFPDQMQGATGDLISLTWILPCTCMHNLSQAIFPLAVHVLCSTLRQDLLYLFHHCIVLVYNLASSLPSKLCQARSQNTSQDKTN